MSVQGLAFAVGVGDGDWGCLKWRHAVQDRQSAFASLGTTKVRRTCITVALGTSPPDAPLYDYIGPTWGLFKRV